MSAGVGYQRQAAFADGSGWCARLRGMNQLGCKARQPDGERTLHTATSVSSEIIWQCSLTGVNRRGKRVAGAGW